MFYLQYIRQCISKGEIPQLCLYSRNDVYASLPECILHIPSYMRRSLPTPPTGSTVSLWQLNTQFRVHVLWATYVNVRDVDMVCILPILFYLKKTFSLTVFRFCRSMFELAFTTVKSRFAPLRTVIKSRSPSLSGTNGWNLI